METSSGTAIGLCIVLFELHKMSQISKAAIKNYQVGEQSLTVDLNYAFSLIFPEKHGSHHSETNTELWFISHDQCKAHNLWSVDIKSHYFYHLTLLLQLTVTNLTKKNAHSKVFIHSLTHTFIDLVSSSRVT